MLTFGVFILLRNVTIKHNGLEKGTGLGDDGRYDPSIVGAIPFSIGPVSKITIESEEDDRWCERYMFNVGMSIPGTTFKGFPAYTKATPYKHLCSPDTHYQYPLSHVVNFIAAGSISLVPILLIRLIDRPKSRTKS